METERFEFDIHDLARESSLSPQQSAHLGDSLVGCSCPLRLCQHFPYGTSDVFVRSQIDGNLASTDTTSQLKIGAEPPTGTPSVRGHNGALSAYFGVMFGEETLDLCSALVNKCSIFQCRSSARPVARETGTAGGAGESSAGHAAPHSSPRAVSEIERRPCHVCRGRPRPVSARGPSRDRSRSD